MVAYRRELYAAFMGAVVSAWLLSSLGDASRFAAEKARELGVSVSVSRNERGWLVCTKEYEDSLREIEDLEQLAHGHRFEIERATEDYDKHKQREPKFKNRNKYIDGLVRINNRRTDNSFALAQIERRLCELRKACEPKVPCLLCGRFHGPPPEPGIGTYRVGDHLVDVWDDPIPAEKWCEIVSSSK